jgi:hypothetical protein
MLKGLAITPPVVGRISIGRVVEKNGKRLPVHDHDSSPGPGRMAITPLGFGTAQALHRQAEVDTGAISVC